MQQSQLVMVLYNSADVQYLCVFCVCECKRPCRHVYTEIVTALAHSFLPTTSLSLPLSLHLSFSLSKVCACTYVTVFALKTHLVTVYLVPMFDAKCFAQGNDNGVAHNSYGKRIAYQVWEESQIRDHRGIHPGGGKEGKENMDGRKGELGDGRDGRGRGVQENIRYVGER